jgi:hypothetical protein
LLKEELLLDEYGGDKGWSELALRDEIDEELEGPLLDDLLVLDISSREVLWERPECTDEWYVIVGDYELTRRSPKPFCLMIYSQ